ncbi:MAG: 3-isopropylmalate dehydratase small subunit [Burkholderiales bacterium]
MTTRFTTLTAIALAYEPINVDTDQIIPARFLKFPRSAGYGRFLFHDLRFADDGSELPDFVLNREPFRRAQILVGNSNFACGSSREGAVYALADHGIRAVIAPSFSDIFFNNCLKNGVVPARLPAEVCVRLREEIAAQPGIELTVDLEALQVREPDGSAHAFSIDAFFREMMLAGVDEIGLTRGMLAEIEAFEAEYARTAPWVAA